MRPFAFVGLVAVSSVGSALAQFASPPPFDPKTYQSPSGHYQLRVNPDDPSASAGASYRLTYNGRVLWERHLPFALLQAGVADDGRFGGYADRAVPSGPPEIVVAVVAANGQVVLSETHKRGKAQPVDSAPTPWLEGLLFDAAHDRMTVRVYDPGLRDGHEQWWTYRLAEATAGPILDPSRYMGGNVGWITDAQLLPGSHLTLISWFDDNKESGAIVTLVDDRAKPVWQLDLKGDYEVGGDEFERAAAVEEFRKTGSLLKVADKQFAIRWVKIGQRVSYGIVPSDQGWKVSETGRSPFTSKATKTSTLSFLPETRLLLKRKWTVPLQRLPDSPIHDVEEFELAGTNRVATLTGGDSPALVLSDLNGKHFSSINLPMLSSEEFPGNHLAWLGASNFVVTHTPKSRKAKTMAWLVDFSTKKIKLFADLGLRRVSAISGRQDGGITILTETNHVYSSDDSVAVYDRRGRLKWERSNGNGYGGLPADMLSPQDVAVDSQGRTTVLDCIQNKIQIFSRSGKFVSTVELPKPKGDDSPYPTNIRCVGTGYLLWESPTAYLLNSNGKVVRKFKPRFADSRPLDARCDPQVGADGKIWISDGNALYRLSRLAVVDRTVGRVGGSRGLREISDLIVTPTGSTLARDKTSDEVRVFNSAGDETATLRPDKAERSETSFTLGESLAVDDLGQIYVHYGAHDVRYSPSARREAIHATDQQRGGPPPDVWRPGWRWKGANILDQNDRTVTTISRLPNEDWLGFYDSVSAVAPTKDVAILSSGDFRRFPRGPVRVGFYGPTGVPKSTATIPIDHDQAYQIAYDGRAVYIPRDGDVAAFDKRGKGLWRFPLPARKGASWKIFLSEGGLAMFDGIDTVYWYATPK